MSVVGSLEDFSPGDLLQAIALLGKSGRLDLEQEGKEGLLLFRQGRIIYAASSAVRETLGGLLLSRELLREDQLREALQRQRESTEETRLGSVLLEMGLISQQELEESIREQFSRIVSEFIAWSSGTFRFEGLELQDHGEVELDAHDFLVPTGLESTHVLLDAARQADELLPREGSVPEPSRHEAEVETHPPVLSEPSAATGDTLGSLLGEIPAPSIGGEGVYRILDVAAEVCGRCVLFAAQQSDFRVLGHFGLDPDGPTSGRELSTLSISRELPSCLDRAVTESRPIVVSLPETELDSRLLEALGGAPKGKSVAVPLAMDGDAMLVLYGDRLSADLSTGWLEQLRIDLQKALAAMAVET